jgi:DUF4097 and DUF4098 domain-containing protein YvlB
MKRIIAVLLTGLLLLSAVGCIRISCSAPVMYANADRYTAGDFTYDESKVKKVEIEWASGSVTLKNGKGTLSVSESGAESLPEAEKLHWWIDGTTLKIKFCKSGTELTLTDLNKKDLTVELPAFVDLEIDVASGKIISENMLDLGILKVKTASGGASIGYLSAKEVGIETASGAWDLGMVSVSGNFKVGTASGGLTVDAITAGSVEVNSASGGVMFGKIAAETVRIDSASGAIRLGLADKEAGAKIDFESVTGSFRCDLPYENSGRTYTIGNGAMKVQIDVVSGSVTVE